LGAWVVGSFPETRNSRICVAPGYYVSSCVYCRYDEGIYHPDPIVELEQRHLMRTQTYADEMSTVTSINLSSSAASIRRDSRQKLRSAWAVIVEARTWCSFTRCETECLTLDGLSNGSRQDPMPMPGQQLASASSSRGSQSWQRSSTGCTRLRCVGEYRAVD
jgi:hypothetical protein